MFNSSIPQKFQIPWANSAPPSNVRSIPIASQISIQAGAASLTDGFPPLNLVPVSAGGVPPFGQDMNGILKQTTQWLQWVAAGGAVRYDAAFVSAVAGYPAGAQITSNSGHAVFESLVDNNALDPNTSLGGGSSLSWRILSCTWCASAWQATGSANVQLVNLSPTPTSIGQFTGIHLTVLSQGTNTGPVTLNVNGLGALPITTAGGGQLPAGALVTSYPFDVVLIGTSSFVLMTRTNTFLDNANNGLTVQGATSAGANILLIGNGNSTPNKYLRSINGLFQVVNSSYTSDILSVDDLGNTNVRGGLAAGGPITGTSLAVGGTISGNSERLTSGAFGTGDVNRVPILNDWALNVVTENQFVARGVNGFMIQMQQASVTVIAGTVTTNVILTQVFASNIIGAMVCLLGNQPPQQVTISAQPQDPGTVAVTVTSPIVGGGSVGVAILAFGH